jgi:hypothetical protein
MKKLNTNAITNELENSSFFPTRTPQFVHSEDPSPAAPAPAVVKPQPPAERPKTVAQKPVTQPVKATTTAGRGYVRRTFDIFEDQLQYLTRASLEDRLAGGEGSMNAMVREALDLLIRERRRKEGSS